MPNLPFPEATPESLGIHSADLSRLVAVMDTLDQAHAFILTRHGKTAASGAWAPYSLDLPHELFSLSKSFVSCAVGIAQSEGRLQINDRLLGFFPEAAGWNPAPAMRRVTLRHLLMMASGHDRCSLEFVDFAHGDWVRQILESPLFYEPGTRFTYNSGATFMLAAVIRRVTGENVVDYLTPRLFAPLGIAKPDWDCNPQGINIGGWGLWLSAADLAKFTQLLLQKGNWEGKQLVPADYLKAATGWQIDNSFNGSPDWATGYGYQFWQCQHRAFRGDGAAGQYALVVPEQDLALTFVSGICDMQRLLTAVWQELLPNLSDRPLPEDEAAHRELQERLARLHTAAPEGIRPPEAPGRGGRYRAAPNPYSIGEVELHFTPDACRLRVDGMTLDAGWGRYVQTPLPLASATSRPVASAAAWDDAGRLQVRALCLATTADFRFTVSFEDDEITVRRTTRIFFRRQDKDIIFRARKCRRE